MKIVTAKLAGQKAIDALYPKPLAGEIKDPSKRVVGQTYNLPAGYHKWTGAGWEPDPEATRRVRAVQFTKGSTAGALGNEEATDTSSDDEGDE